MDMHRWDRLESLFSAVAELPVSERSAYLDETCSDDAALRLQVESLLSATEEASGFIGGAIAEVALEATRVARIGQRLGAYEIVRELGHGGMGAVFLGRRADEEYEADVAIKLIAGLHTAEHLRRFRTERQILASLQHPNIARLLDGGTTAEGVPYVVMEYVDGVPLDTFCDRHGLDVDRRLELFAQVFAAVRYAHQRLVVHCDLKPGNILVTAEGTPKLLDFGIARLLDPRAGAGATRATVRLGTPAYVSPEQIVGSPLTVATDVHGLGVVLYELLTGRLPYPLRGKSVHEMERVVLEGSPVRPSAAAVDPAVARRLAGDLDAVLLTALERDPARRYDSVERFADDVARHRAGRPVLARAQTWPYRARTFIRRHRFGVGVAAAAVLVLSGFASTMAVQAGRIARERDAATVARADAEQVSSFLIDLFQVSDPGESRGNEVTAREILDRGAARIGTELGDQPATRATMLDVLGRVYYSLGLYDQAGPLLDSALALRRATFGEEHVAVAGSLHARAELLGMLGDYDGARALYRQVIDMRRRLLPPDHPDLAMTLSDLATVESDAGNYGAAEPLQREALAIHRAVHGSDHVVVAVDLLDLGSSLRRKGDYAAAEPLLREGLAINRRLLGDDHQEVAYALNQLARLLVLQGRSDEALPHAREGLAIRRKVVGDRHPEVAASLGNLAGILSDLGDWDGAIAARRESLEILRDMFGEAHPYTAATLQSLASVHHQAGALDSARVNYEYAIALQQDLLAEDDPNRGFALTGLGRVLVDAGRAAEAEPHLREALGVRRAGLPEGHWFIASTEVALGSALTRLGRYAEAQTLLTRGHERLKEEFGEADERTAEAGEQLAALQRALP